MNILKSLFLSITLILVACTNEIAQNEVQKSNEFVLTDSLQSRTIEDRFAGDNLTIEQASAIAVQLLRKVPFFYFKDVIGREPVDWLSYGPFSVTYNGLTIKFRGISARFPGYKHEPFGLYADYPVTSVDIYSAQKKEYPNVHGDIIYEKDATTNNLHPVGVRFLYHLNCGTNDFWLLVEWESLENFQKITLDT